MSVFACLGSDAVSIRDAYVSRLGASVEVHVCVCLGGKKRKQKQNKSKGSVGYSSVLSQVCQTKTSNFVTTLR